MINDTNLLAQKGLPLSHSWQWNQPDTSEGAAEDAVVAVDASGYSWRFELFKAAEPDTVGTLDSVVSGSATGLVTLSCDSNCLNSYEVGLYRYRILAIGATDAASLLFLSGFFEVAR